jgi:hypothetical protein
MHYSEGVAAGAAMAMMLAGAKVMMGDDIGDRG